MDLRKCGEILRVMAATNQVLYRGDVRYGDETILWETGTNVNSLHEGVDPSVVGEIDEWLSRWGFTALRKNSLFTTSYFHQAEMYGPVHIILPLDGFSYTWMGHSSDLYHDLQPWIRGGRLTAGVGELLPQLKPRRDGLEEGMALGHEILLSGPYYALPVGKYSINDLLEN